MLREKATSSIVALAVAFGVTLAAPAAWAQQAGDQPQSYAQYQGQPYQPPPPGYQGQPYQPPPPGYQGQPYQPPPPQYQPPPPQYQPPPPPYVQPQYVYAPQPRLVYRPYYFRPQIGLGLRVSGMWSDNDWTDGGPYSYYSGFSQYGIGGEILGRVAPRLALELAIQYQSTGTGGSAINAVAGYYARTDVPVTLGLRFYMGPLRWAVSPYLVGAVGGDYGKATTCGDANCSATAILTDTAGYFEVQGGVGLEIRVGRHFAITGDIRGTGRIRLDSPSPVTAGGNDIMGSQGGIQGNFGLAGYL